MKQKKSFGEVLWIWLIFLVPVLWLGALAACAYTEGMTIFSFVRRFSETIRHPFHIHWTAHTPKFLASALFLYAGGIVFYHSSRQNRRPGEEHGSAKWGSVRQLNRKYRDRKRDNNVILTQHLQMSLNGRKHMRNLLQIVVGGSGSGKTRFLVKPNILLANTSYIVTDPKGELLRSAGAFLLKEGYVLRVIDLVDPAHSDCYNPFSYIRKDSDVFRLIDNFIKNTTPKNAQSNDPFWESATRSLAVRSQRTSNKYRCLDNW